MPATIKVIPIVIPNCYDDKMTQKVGPKGQVVIPKKFRDQLGIEPGDEVIVSLTESGVLVQAVHSSQSLRGMFAGSGMIKMLMDDRRKEAR